MMELFQRQWVRLVFIAACVVLVLWLLYKLSDPLTPFAVAFVLAYVLNPMTNWMERAFARILPRVPLGSRVPPRGAALGVLAVLLVALLVVVAVVLIPAVYHQVAEAIGKVPEYLATLRTKVEPAYQRLHLRYPEQTEEARERVAAAMKTNMPKMLSPITKVVGKAFSSLLDFVLTLLNLFIIPVFAFYLLYDMNSIREGMKSLVPVRFRPYMYSRMGEVDRLLAAFVRGQLTVSLILGGFYAVGLTLCGVPMGLLVGFVIGLFNLVPFMSYILGLPLALVLSWLDDQAPAKLLAVAAVFVLGQFIEGNFVTPKIVGESLGLHAVIIMLAVLVGGTWFGFVGMVLAVPATAALSVFWADLRQWYLGSDFYRGGGEPDPTVPFAVRAPLAAEPSLAPGPPPVV